MNFKRFISGVSALTIAASAFAGLKISASAVYVPDGEVSYTNGGTSSSNKTNTISLEDVITNETTGIINISYAVSTDVDYTSGSGRPGYITLVGKDADGEDAYIADFYANTARAGQTYNQAGYSIGGQIASGDAASRLSTTEKSFNYNLYLDLDNDKIWGTITGTAAGSGVNISIAETDMEISTLSRFDVISQSSANTMEISNISINSVVYRDVESELSSIEVSGNSFIEYDADKQFQLFAIGYDQFDQVFDTDITWSSDNQSVATIDAATGIATTTGAGSVTFTAAAGEVKAEYTVTVNAKPARDEATSIISEDYSDYENGTNLVYQEDPDGEHVVVPSTHKGITYNQVARGNGSNTTKMTVSDGQGVVFLGNPASAARVPRMEFNDAVALADIVSTNDAAEVLEFDLSFKGTYEMVRVYDGTSVSASGYQTVVNTTIATIKNTKDGVLLGADNTGLKDDNTIHVKVILDANAAYVELKDTVTNITYAGFGTKTDKIGGIVFGNDTNAGTMYIDNVEYYINGTLPEEPEENTVEAEKVGTESYTDEETGIVYTPFTATISTTPISVKVTGEDNVEYNGEITNVPTIDGEAVVGIIVSGLQKAIKVVFTVE